MPFINTPAGMGLIGFVLMLVVMQGITIVANRWKNAGLVDIVWAFGFVGMSGLYVLLAHGWPPRQALAAGMMGVANLRLGLHLLKRFRHEFPVEDGRYHGIRELWNQQHPERTDCYFALVFQAQGVLIVLLSLPVAVACVNTRTGFGPLEYCSFLIWLLGGLIAWLSDRQLATFKAGSANKEKVCAVGLWRYSRHPNYFGEWLLWVSYWLVACGSPGGIWTIYAPGVMFLMLRYFSGVKATESQALKKRGDAYRQYQQDTPVFFPSFPRQKLH